MLMNNELDLFASAGNQGETRRVLYLDTETTGIDTETSQICEVAFLLSTYNGFSRIPDQDIELIELVLPQDPVPPEASAIHHITNNMLEGKPSIESISDSIQELIGKADLICAHNLPFDLGILTRQLPGVFSDITPDMKLDSLRLSRHTWPSIPSHALQVLRYRFELDASISGNAHRAMFDTKLVRALVEFIIEQHLTTSENWKKLVEFTQSSLEIKIFSFGKYRGKLVEDIVAQDEDYIRWLLRQHWVPDDYPDLYHTLLRKTGNKGSKK
jgi:exodeoxyribonuclease X